MCQSEGALLLKTVTIIVRLTRWASPGRLPQELAENRDPAWGPQAASDLKSLGSAS